MPLDIKKYTSLKKRIGYIKDILEKSKNAHEQLLLKDIENIRKSNIRNIINKIDNVLAEYFSDKTQEVNYWRINIGIDMEEWSALVRDNKIGIGFASEYIKEKLFEYKSKEE